MPIDYNKRPSTPPAAPAPASPTPANGPVSLTKRGESVSLTKSAGGEPYRFNLNWDSGGHGMFKRGANIDLDLGCLYELTNGRKGPVQALGNAFGSLDGPPWIKLDGDDRSGAASDGENLLISSAHQHEIARMIVFAFIYEGVANWSEAKAVATIHQPAGPPITINLDEHADGRRMCAIALLTNTGSGMTLQREINYVPGHRDLDAAYNWGLRWTAGHK